MDPSSFLAKIRKIEARLENVIQKIRKVGGETFFGYEIEVGAQCSLVTNLVTNLSPNLVTNLVIAKFGDKFGDEFGDTFSEHPIR